MAFSSMPKKVFEGILMTFKGIFKRLLQTAML